MNAKRIIAGMSALLLLLTSCQESGYSSETEAAAPTTASNTSPVTEEQPAAEPITLTLASYGSNYIPIVNKFNSSQSEYYIEIVDYSKDDTISKENALKQINAELASGEGPDLFYLWKLGMNNAIYGPKGYLEDLLLYIDQDPELSRENFVESLMEGAKIDGKLYGTNPSFSIFTMFGPESQLAQYQLGTFSDLLEVAQTHGGMSALLNQDYDATSFLYTIVQIASDEFIDFSTMTADFDNDNFRALLDLCLQFDDASSTREKPGILNGHVSGLSGGKVCIQGAVPEPAASIYQGSAVRDSHSVHPCKPPADCHERRGDLSHQPQARLPVCCPVPLCHRDLHPGAAKGGGGLAPALLCLPSGAGDQPTLSSVRKEQFLCNTTAADILTAMKEPTRESSSIQVRNMDFPPKRSSAA